MTKARHLWLLVLALVGVFACGRPSSEPQPQKVGTDFGSLNGDVGGPPWANFIQHVANPGALSYSVAVPKISAIGDSQTQGHDNTYNGLVGGWVGPFVQQLRQWRGDFEMVASQVQQPEGSAGASVIWNEGHAGYKIADLNSNYATWLASTLYNAQPPDIDIVMIGTNDASTGRTAAQMETDWSTLYTTILTANPNALIVAVEPPPFVQGTLVTSGNQTTWNGVLSTYNAWLSGTHQPANAAHEVVSTCAQSLTVGDRLVDGVHETQQGEAVIGECLARQLNALLGVPRGPPQASVDRFDLRQPWASYQLTSTSDYLALASHTGFNPGAGSFTFAFDVYPTSLPAGASSLFQYGSSAVNNYYGVLQQGGALQVYWDNSSITIGSGVSSMSSTSALSVGKWHRIVVMADAVHGVVALYVNGRLAGLQTGIGAWTNTQQNVRIGFEPVFGQGVPGYYSRVWAAKAIPGEPGGVAALRAVEADYYLGDSLVPGQATASFPLDAVLADDVYAPGAPNPSFTLGGSAASVAAYPSGTPLRPWELDGRWLPTTLYDPAGAPVIYSPAAGQTNLYSSGTQIGQLARGFGDFLALGPAPAQTGNLRVPNNTIGMSARNAANSADIQIFRTDGSNEIIYGDVANATNAFVRASANVQLQTTNYGVGLSDASHDWSPTSAGVSTGASNAWQLVYANAYRYPAADAAPLLVQDTQTNGGPAPPNLLIQPQFQFGTDQGSAAKNTPASLIFNLGVPFTTTNAGSEPYVKVQRNGVTYAAIGAWPTTPGTWAGLYLGPSVNPVSSPNSFTLLTDVSTTTYVNGFTQGILYLSSVGSIATWQSGGLFSGVDNTYALGSSAVRWASANTGATGFRVWHQGNDANPSAVLGDGSASFGNGGSSILGSKLSYPGFSGQLTLDNTSGGNGTFFVGGTGTTQVSIASSNQTIQVAGTGASGAQAASISVGAQATNGGASSTSGNIYLLGYAPATAGTGEPDVIFKRGATQTVVIGSGAYSGATYSGIFLGPGTTGAIGTYSVLGDGSNLFINANGSGSNIEFAFAGTIKTLLSATDLSPASSGLQTLGQSAPWSTSFFGYSATYTPSYEGFGIPQGDTGGGQNGQCIRYILEKDTTDASAHTINILTPSGADIAPSNHTVNVTLNTSIRDTTTLGAMNGGDEVKAACLNNAGTVTCGTNTAVWAGFGGSSCVPVAPTITGSGASSHVVVTYQACVAHNASWQSEVTYCVN